MKSKLITRVLLSACFYGSLSLAVIAQEDDEDIYEISPFQVDGSGDTGYLAGSTLAGTRLNSNLNDVAAAISPFTKEFINDIGANSVEELLAYSNNTVRLDESELSNGNQVLEFEFQFNIRGLPATRSRNYFLADTISMDNFNVERVDESRGPNSILFGVGSAGGVVNTSTKRARFSEINEVQLMTGSNSQFRTAIDFNRVLIEDTLAIRFNAVYDTDESWRMWEFKDQERFALAATWKVGENTIIRGEMEWGEINDNLGRSYLGEDHTTEWIEDGKQDRSMVTGGAYNGSRNNAWINIPDDGILYFSSGGGRAYNYNVPGGRQVLMNEESILFEQGLIDWTVNPGGPDNTRLTDYTTWSVFLEQRIGDNFNIEAAFNHLDTYFNQYDTTSNGYRLRPDITDPTLGVPTSPKSGEYFYESLWTRRWRDRIADTARVTASYELDLDNFGRHRFAAMYETQDANPKRESSFQFLANDEGILATPTAPGSISASGRNSIWQRNYITLGDYSTYTTGSWKNPVSVDIDGDTYTAQFFPRNANVTDDDVALDSFLVSMQNFWFDGRVVTTYGYREDDITIEKRGQTTHPTNQRIVVDYDTPPEKFDFSGGTTTLGVVVKPTDWLSLLYNDSDNQGLPDVNKIVLPNSSFADPSEGEGNDYGFMLNLMEGRVFARFARFESSMFGLADFGNRGNIENPNIRALDVLLDAGLIDQATRDNREVVTNTFTFGRESEGYEAQITANLTDNWSLRFNYSKTDRIRFNVMPEVLAWFPEQVEYWRSFGDDVFLNIGEDGPGSGPYTPSTGGRDSIAEEVDRAQNYIDNRTAFDGIGDQGSRSDSANMFTNYRFTEGDLAGFNIGGGIRYLGPMAVAVDVPNASLVWGNSKTLVDFLMGYRMKATDKVDIRFQLNIRNLFDERDYTITGLQLDGRLDRLRLETPREYQFRTTLSW